MFEEFRGIPLHPLLVHAAVVFVPLFVASVIGYALVPRLRAFLGWLTAALAVVVAASTSAWIASSSAWPRMAPTSAVVSTDAGPLAPERFRATRRT